MDKLMLRFKLRKRMVLLLIFLPCTTLYAQENLSLKDAISIALEKNYDVQQARLQSEQALNNATAGEAGMLPSLTLDGAYSRTELSLNQELADGRVIERDGAASTLYSGAATLNWTLFDGLTMFAKKSRLGSLAEESRLALGLQMEATVQQVIGAYFAVRVVQEQLNALQELLKVDSIRIQLAQARLEAGNGAKPALLQAKLEQHQHLSQQMALLSDMAGQKENLNVLLGRDPALDFTTTDSIMIMPVKAEESTRGSDLMLRLAGQQQQSAFQLLKEYRGARWPSLQLFANYNSSNAENEAGFILKNSNFGPGAGLRLQWNLFNGFRASRMIQNAGIGVQLAESRQAQALQSRVQAERKLTREFNDRMAMVALEEQSRLLAAENLQIAVERLRSGLATSLEIQEAQRAYNEVIARLFTAKYNAKVSETAILRLRGELLK